MKKLALIVLAIAVLSVTLWFGTSNRQKGDVAVDFSTDIKPILNKHCTTCHGGVKKLGELSLLFEDEAFLPGESGKTPIVRGDAAASEMYRRIASDDPSVKMPPEGPGLSDEEIALVERWINEGAPWGKHWAYKTLEEVPVPKNNSSFEKKYADWIKNEIDRFILKKLSDLELPPSEEALTTTLARRISLDLVGLPPSKIQLEAFEKANTPQAAEKWLDDLLASPQFGERWASMWMDLARYADTKGYEKDSHREIWKYRDWLIQAFNEDMPFDEFTIQQLAGDLLPHPSTESLIATAFHRNTMTNDEGGTNNEEFRVAAVIDRVNTTWEAWLGTSIGCAQCHNHPYDPFKMEDFYKSYAFFNNTADQDISLEMPNLRLFDSLTEDKITQLKTWLSRVPDIQEDQWHTFEKLIYFQEPKITLNQASETKHFALSNETLTYYHDGSCKFTGVNLTGKENVLVRFTHCADGKIALRLDRPDGPVISEWKVKKGQRGLFNYKVTPVNGQHDLYLTFDYIDKTPMQANSGIYFLVFYPDLPGQQMPGHAAMTKTLEDILQSKPATTVPVLLDNDPNFHRKTYTFVRGNWMVPDQEVFSEVPESIPPKMKKEKATRLDLAHWMVSPENPLLARVLVNRIWEQLFGRGIVETVEDLGTQGIPPSHRELLDWLSYRFIHHHKWSLKALLKEIVQSATYRQESNLTEMALAKDPNNIYLGRGPRIRLTAEQVRDQTLAVTGLISLKQFGPSVMPVQPEGVWQVVYNSASWKTSVGEDRYRRAIYTYWRRTSPYPSMISFDSPSREFCVSRRIRTNTPLQALVTLNDPVYIEAAGQLAAQMLPVSENKTVDDAIRHAYQLILFESIPENNLKTLTQLYQQTHQYYSENPQEAEELWKNQFKETVASGDLPGDVAAFAALTTVANALLNLDAFLTKS